MQWFRGRSRRRLVILTGILTLISLFGGYWGLPWVLLARASTLIGQRDLDGAERWYHRAEFWKHATPEICLGLARIARLRGDGREVANQLQRAQRVGADAERVELEWLMADAQGGSVEALGSQFMRLCALHPQDGDELSWAMASGMLSLRRFAEAEAFLMMWQESDREDPRPFFLLGESLREQQRMEESLEMYQRSIDLAPQWYEPYLAAASVLESMRRHEDARETYDRIPEEGSQGVEVIYGKASVHNALGEYPEAQADLERLLERYPDHYPSLVLLSQIHQLNENWQAMVEVLEPLRKKYPEDMEINLQLAQAYAKFGKTAESQACEEQYKKSQAVVADFERRKALIPQNANDSQYFRDLAERILPHRYHEAEPLLYTSLALNPKNADAYRLLAEVARRRGDQAKTDYFRFLAQRVAK